MVWLWIIVTLSIIFASISWILPTKIERKIGSLRMEAIQIGLKVKILSADKWTKNRIDTTGLMQYIMSTKNNQRPLVFWRVNWSGQPWTSRPNLNEKKLSESTFCSYLEKLPDAIVGVGAEKNYVWVALNDQHISLTAFQIKGCLESLVEVLARKSE